jgi:exonuclease SbcC
MIKKLHIKNFQSHEDTTLEFSPGVNIIVGSSDSGKTAIIRALRWLVWNRPSGDTIRSNWGGETCVTLETEKGTISRIKDKVDSYVLDAGTGKDSTFKAFGTSVPEEISNFFNINEVNLQQQLDSPFLLSESPGAVASYFNKVANLSKIDTATANVKAWITELTASIKHKETDISTNEEKLKQFEYLSDFEKSVLELEETEGLLEDKKSGKEDLEGILIDITNLDYEIKEGKTLLPAEDLVNTILSSMVSYKETDKRTMRLEDLVKQICEVDEQLEEEQKILKAGPLVNDMLIYSQKKGEIYTNQIRLTNLLNRIKFNVRELLIADENLKVSQRLFDEAFPNACPLCGKPK